MLRALALLALVTACRATPAFTCERDDQCTGGGAAGRCEATRYCSFADSSCPSGQRYDEYAGDGLGGTCVGGNPKDANDLDQAPGEPTITPLCSADPDLRACYTFDTTTADGSMYGNNATATAASYVAGHDGQGQAIVTSTGTITVGSTTSLDIPQFTFKMWIRATTIPTTRAGLLDSASRYRMFLQANGALRCAITGGTDLTSATGVITAATWHRVACRFTGTNMKIFVDGTEVANSNTSSSVPANGAGMVIGHNNPTGENFDGAIDDLQVWSSTAIAP